MNYYILFDILALWVLFSLHLSAVYIKLDIRRDVCHKIERALLVSIMVPIVQLLFLSLLEINIDAKYLNFYYKDIKYIYIIVIQELIFRGYLRYTNIIFNAFIYTIVSINFFISHNNVNVICSFIEGLILSDLAKKENVIVIIFCKLLVIIYINIISIDYTLQ